MTNDDFGLYIIPTNSERILCEKENTHPSSLTHSSLSSQLKWIPFIHNAQDALISLVHLGLILELKCWIGMYYRSSVSVPVSDPDAACYRTQYMSRSSLQTPSNSDAFWKKLRF